MNKGAVASFTNTRLGVQFGSDTIRNRFMDAVFDDGIWFLGATLTQAKATDPPSEGYAYRGFYSRYTVNEFGSPITEAWTDIPKTTRIWRIQPSSIPEDQTSNVAVYVQVKIGSYWFALPTARVTLYGCNVYSIGYTNEQGRVSFTITPTEPGTITVTATKHDHLYSQGGITVLPAKSGLASDAELPLEFFMSLASSNPVKGNLKLKFGIPLEDEGFVSLKIYDVSGRCVQTVFSEEKTAGFYEVSIPTGSLPAGAYFIGLEAGIKAKTEKLIKGGE